ncbi:hypothetical protein KUTeg_000913 [Tegillarca granosa]|uniref:Transposable element P transposase-like RNase H domain-containing protein n=1 Tax=Tegillarca granosa TaxID=220873 RepID=A0ABQ9FZS1_TEGGR|nr:hypothetical protein KUTeg_000913 [Tegillarca granosa]
MDESNVKLNTTLHDWLFEHLEKGNENEFVELVEILTKLKENVTGVAIGNVLKKIFPDVKVKHAREKNNWSKLTKRYCEGAHSASKTDITLKRKSQVQMMKIQRRICYRSKSCSKILPFMNSNRSSKKCSECKKLDKAALHCTSEDYSNINLENDTTVILNPNDHNDISMIFADIFPNCSDKMKTFLMSQKMAIEQHPKGRRWHKDVIRLCLTLWCRSPKGYSELRNSKFIMLPSEKILQKYKNHVKQDAGINKDMLHWMLNEAKVKNIPPEGYEGGLLVDEMSIQPDLQLKKINGEIELVGFNELTPESIVFDQIKSNKTEIKLATHALQFVFLGFTGFRFPFAHFSSQTASGHELYLLIWNAVNMLLNFGFKIQYISTDGAQTNRDLFKLLLPDFSTINPITCAFPNIYSLNSKICFIMDISHTIKKIRNNIAKSGDSSHCKRHLKLGLHFIEWKHFQSAYLWDISTHPFPVHHKLTQEHFFLTSESKMRNHLAEDVLNDKMIHLMELYQKN